jgi:hypothetical protein
MLFGWTQGAKEVDHRKGLAVKRTAEALDHTSWQVLAETRAHKGLSHPPRTAGQALSNVVSLRQACKRLEKAQEGAAHR